MERFKEYVRTGGQSPAPESATVDSLVAEFPWFTAARVVRANVGGFCDPLLNVLKTNRALSSLSLKPIDTERLAAVTEGEIIDKFLRLGDYRIVADELPIRMSSAPKPNSTTRTTSCRRNSPKCMPHRE